MEDGPALPAACSPRFGSRCTPGRFLGLRERDRHQKRQERERQGRLEGPCGRLLHGGRQALLPGLLGRAQRTPAEPTRAQVKFKRDYSGGYMKLGTPLWKNIRNVCRPYAGPPLAWYVTGCTAPDGSHWVLQSWQRRLPNLGMTPWLAAQRVWELHLSHFTGHAGRPRDLHGLHLLGRSLPPPLRPAHVRDHPVYGFGNTASGVPTDTVRAERLRRHLQLAATGAAGSARTASLPTASAAPSVTASTPRPLRVLPGRPTPTAGKRRGAIARP